MKIKNDLMLRNIAGDWIVVPMGERLTEFSGMMKINGAGAFLWKLMEKDAAKEQLIAAFLQEYEVDEITAFRDVEAFIKTLSDAHVLEA